VDADGAVKGRLTRDGWRGKMFSPERAGVSRMYYEAYSRHNTNFSTSYFFRDRKVIFHIASSVPSRPSVSIDSDHFAFTADKKWFEKPVPGQSVLSILDENKQTVATVTFLGGNMNLLQYGRKYYRIMKLADSYLAFSEDNRLVSCIKPMSQAAEIPFYACDKEGPSYEIMVDDDLPLPLQAILAASNSITFLERK